MAGWSDHDEAFHSGASPQEREAAKKLGLVMAAEMEAAIERQIEKLKGASQPISAPKNAAEKAAAKEKQALAKALEKEANESFKAIGKGMQESSKQELVVQKAAAKEKQALAKALEKESEQAFNGISKGLQEITKGNTVANQINKKATAGEFTMAALERGRVMAQGAGLGAYIVSATAQQLASSYEQFAQPIDTLFGYFRNGIESVGRMAKNQFESFTNYETDILTAANDLRNSFTKSKYDKTPLLNMDEAMDINQKLRPKLITMANELPGENKDYLMLGRSLIDSAAIAARGDKSKIEPIITALTKTTVLATVTGGKSPAVGVTGMNQYLSTGLLNSQSALGKAAPALMEFLNNPRNGSSGTYEQRVDKVVKAGNTLYPKEVTDRYQNTFSTKINQVKEQLTGETGIFSFVRDVAGGKSIGDRIKDLFDKVVPDFTPLSKVVDRGVVALEKIFAPMFAFVGKRLQGAGDRIAALQDQDFLNPTKLFGAVTELTQEQQVKLVNDVFNWITNLVKGIGEALRGGAGDPVVKALVDGITGLFREIQMQKLQITIQNAPALAAADPLGALGLAAGVVGFIAQLVIAASFVGTFISGIGGLVTVLVGVVTAVVAFVAGLFGLPFVLAGLLVAAVVGLVAAIILNWGTFVAYVKSSWKSVVDFFIQALQFLNPMNGITAAGKYIAGAVGIGTAPTGATPAAPPAPAPKKTEVSLNVTDRLGTLNAVTKDNLIGALGEALSQQYGSLFEAGYS
jgi:hypothetical protein